MRNFYTSFVALLCVVAMCVGCSDSSPKAVKGVKHVVMVGYDGLAGNTVEAAEMPTLKAMMDQGAWTLQARSILPSSSACNWATMFMGAGPEMHGYNTWGSRKPDFPSIALGKNGIFPTFITAIREKYPDANMCSMYEWDVIGDLIDNKAITYHEHVPAGESECRDITDAYIAYLTEHKPQVSMCIYDSPDHEGHGQGWASETYMSKLTLLDNYLAEIIQATKDAGMYDQTIFVIVSDHGGIGKGHGSTSMSEMEAPLIFFGKGIKKGYKIEVPVMRYDTAPTITRIFGVASPDVWRGRAIEEIFE